MQLVGGIALFEGHLAEMQTGEGKTLTAVLPTYLRALEGRGCHVVTVNDYLAKRDADEMGAIHELLGLSVGCLTADMDDDQRQVAYSKNVTYGTAKEFGFDFLRDRLRIDSASRAPRTSWQNRNLCTTDGPLIQQQGHHFALIDEADSILIDEARTPLIISALMPNSPARTALFRWGQRIVGRLDNNIDYLYAPARRRAELTDNGCRKINSLPRTSLIDCLSWEEIYSQLENVLVANLGFHRDKHYLVKDHEVVIIDESTGREMEGRKWPDGLHQAIEAKEGLPITAATGEAAQITIQNFFRQYSHLAGMTGTALSARSELKHAYNIDVATVPTHRPCIRRQHPAHVYLSRQAKHAAILERVRQMLEQGRAVLIGTPSVNASELLGQDLRDNKIDCQILNAKNHAEEAAIVAQAGQPKKVTIATNMAGRGTDILLHKSVRDAGGLHVIATERHSSTRIDRQLIGRSARQGDPGSFEFVLSFDDELLRSAEENELAKWVQPFKNYGNKPLPKSAERFFTTMQTRIENKERTERQRLLDQEKQRLEFYSRVGLDPYLDMTD